MAIAKKAAAILTAASLLVAPVAASAAPVAASAAPVARANAPVATESNLGGEHGGGTILLVAVLAGMAYALYELVSDDDLPTSP